jgi:hypothetical protein
MEECHDRKSINGLSSGCRIRLEFWQEYDEEAPGEKFEATTMQGQEIGRCPGYHKVLEQQTCVQTCQGTRDTTAVFHQGVYQIRLQTHTNSRNESLVKMIARMDKSAVYQIF